MTVDSIKRTKVFRTMRSSLIDRLERSGNDTPYYLDLVNDYMNMYITKELCNHDIADRGVSITSVGSTGQLITKKNESVNLLLRTNQQMIKLLDMLGIKPETGYEDDGEL